MRNKIALCAALLMLSGCDQIRQANKSESKPKDQQNAAEASAVGRYVIVHSPQVERDTILLDTVTGKTWERVEFTDMKGDPSGWEPMARTDVESEFQPFMLGHEAKAKNSN